MFTWNNIFIKKKTKKKRKSDDVKSIERLIPKGKNVLF